MNFARPTLVACLFLSLASVAACSAPVEDESDSNEGAFTNLPPNPGTGVSSQGIRLTEENCALSNGPVYGTGAPIPLYCYPTGELLGKESFLKAADPAQTIERSWTPPNGRIGLSILDARSYLERRQAWFGQGDTPSFFAVNEVPSVVAFQGKVEVYESEEEELELTIADATILAFSSNLKPQEASLREAFRGSTSGFWTSGAKDLQGQALAPKNCSKATVVLKAEPGGLLPSDQGTESFAVPQLVAFYCDN